GIGGLWGWAVWIGDGTKRETDAIARGKSGDLVPGPFALTLHHQPSFPGGAERGRMVPRRRCPRRGGAPPSSTFWRIAHHNDPRMPGPEAGGTPSASRVRIDHRRRRYP